VKANGTYQHLAAVNAGIDCLLSTPGSNSRLPKPVKGTILARKPPGIWRMSIYTFWKYFRNAFARDAGLRIDHLLLSPPIAGRLVAAGVDRAARGREHASDHAPAWIEIADTTIGPRRGRRVAASPLHHNSPGGRATAAAYALP